MHCPNPGRLREILRPGRKLILEKSENPARKTRWTLAAAVYRGLTIPLVSAGANKLVGELLLPEFYPDYKLFPEKTYGKSRFDWFLEKNADKIWLEVKACTLVEHGRALFPDAPSVRARKHTEELTAIRDGSRREIIFAVMNPAAAIFSPNPHTDPDLCLSLMKASDEGVNIRACSFRTNEEGWTQIENIEIPVDMQSAALVKRDSGVIVRIWEQSGEHSSWTISIHRYETGLRKLCGSPVKKSELPGPDYTQAAAFPIFGELKCFDVIENELELLGASTEGNPVSDPAFLDLILDYRHSRVFNS